MIHDNRDHTGITRDVNGTKVAFGCVNGVWGAWYIVDGVDGNFMAQSSRADAVKVYDDLYDALAASYNAALPEQE
jgi:hypothetical protein